jgi:hypothetical protein
VTKLHPVSPGQLALSLGNWSAVGVDAQAAQLDIDPRLFAWLVNAAWRRSSKTYKINEGSPPVKVTLSPA